MTKEQINEFTLRTTQANHSGLVVILFEIERIYLADSLACYEAGDREEFVRNLEKAKKAHNELMAAMDTKDVIGFRVYSLLRYMYKLMVKASVRRDAEELDRVDIMLEKLEESFKVLHEKDSDAAVMKNTHQVYAGLTYGKGRLNESYGSADYSNRGFRA